MELTAAASRSAEERLLGLPVSTVASPGNDGLQAERAAAPASIGVSAVAELVEGRAEAERVVPPPAQFQHFDNTVDMSVEIAKDMQARLLEDLKIGMHAALDYAKNLARMQRPTDEDASAAGIAAADGDKLDPFGSAAECRAVVLELRSTRAQPLPMCGR
ncbi:hypothetical protein XH88_02045 [Bradyrhizobium sp. CCBAU 51627]|nr:hypothetical protein [Bradyrhizobium sp. CCBAU 51627]